MTEIQWLINLMVNHPLDESVKKLCLERIGEVERGLTVQRPQPQVYVPQIQAPLGTPPISQAQARDMAMNQPAPIAQPLPIKPTQEIITGVGNGTQIRGKRKF